MPRKMPSTDVEKLRRAKDEVREGWTHESAGWVKHARTIARWSAEATALVVDGSRARPGDRVLDVASGPGTVAFALAPRVKPGGTVVSSDLVPAMVHGAQRLGAELGLDNVSYREADAESLPFPDEGFDVVTCLHGAMFFPDAEGALREFRRVLRPGGRTSILVWGPPERNPFLTTMSGPFMRRMGASGPADPDEPGPFRYARSGSLGKVVEAAGLTQVREELHEIDFSFPGSPEEMWPAAQEISSSLFGWFRATLPPAEFEAAAQEVQAAIRSRYDGTAVRFTAAMVLVTAQRSM